MKKLAFIVHFEGSSICCFEYNLEDNPPSPNELLAMYASKYGFDDTKLSYTIVNLLPIPTSVADYPVCV